MPVPTRTQRGAALIESTLVLMVLLTLLFGIFDFGYVMFEHHTLMHQARTAARYGAIHPSDSDAIRNIVMYGEPTASSGSSTGFFGLEASMVSVSRQAPWTSADRIVIVISGYRYTLVTPFLAGTFTGRPIQVSLPVETQ